ncbi:HNH endonuclease [Gulosibacter macacae]|uniref:HNH endonuclease n=1 Tax=Gulosibacter macacae TaxID=2488791 RepID=A0A3P3VT03_9MICO|nr:HNH endonuclease signature motif containing protein [Gulosibacter macacae]RRJ85932.1 HNH endonuclease [Gulosibacter macacae]
MAVDKRLTALVLARDNHLCVIAGPRCGGWATVPDHRANRGAGGSRALDDAANLIAACGVCNGNKEDATGEWLQDLIRRGVRVLRRGQRSAQVLTRARLVPVEYPDGTWWQLDSAGGRTPCLRSVATSERGER